MEILRETNLSGLGTKKIGKVRDIYEQQDRFIFVTTDRHSSFDRIIAHIPSKGQVLNQVSAFWFEATKDIIPNHVLSVPDPNVTIGKYCTPVKIEGVVRGYLTGVTGTAIWTRYQKGIRDFGGVTLPDGMKKNVPLPQPIFDPTTKEDAHDRAISQKEMIAEGIVTDEMFQKVKDVSLQLFRRGQDMAAEKGLILVDTKYEFGIDANGTLTVIDEMHTPDSSRFWQLDSYAERVAKDEEPQYFDKEFLRLWFMDHCDPYKDAVLPEAPQELVDELSRRYIQMYEQITGLDFVPGETPILERIERNLSPQIA